MTISEREFDGFQEWMRGHVRSYLANSPSGLWRNLRSDALVAAVAYMPLKGSPTKVQVEHAAAVASDRCYRLGLDWRQRVPEEVARVVDTVMEDPLLIEVGIRKRPVPPFLTYDRDEDMFVVNLDASMEGRAPRSGVGQRGLLESRRCLGVPTASAVYFEPCVMGAKRLRAPDGALDLFLTACARSSIERDPKLAGGALLTRGDPGRVVLTSAYDPAITEAVRALPSEARRFDGSSRSWVIAESELERLSSSGIASLLAAIAIWRRKVALSASTG